jgi:hypothetical protein
MGPCQQAQRRTTPNDVEWVLTYSLDIIYVYIIVTLYYSQRERGQTPSTGLPWAPTLLLFVILSTLYWKSCRAGRCGAALCVINILRTERKPSRIKGQHTLDQGGAYKRPRDQPALQHIADTLAETLAIGSKGSCCGNISASCKRLV